MSTCPSPPSATLLGFWGKPIPNQRREQSILLRNNALSWSRMSEYLNKTILAKQDRPDVQIFMALLQSNLWRPSDSGRRIVLDWLHYVARTSLASCQSHGVMERREAFRAALAAEDTEVPRHPSQASTSNANKCLQASNTFYGTNPLHTTPSS